MNIVTQLSRKLGAAQDKLVVGTFQIHGKSQFTSKQQKLRLLQRKRKVMKLRDNVMQPMLVPRVAGELGR